MDWLTPLGYVALFVFALVFARWFAGIGVGAPWLPVRKQDMEAAFRLIDIGPEDVVIDLGSGDGRLLIAVAKRGARVVGYELNPIMVWISRWRLRAFGNRATIYRKNLLQADFSEASIIFVFGITKIMPDISHKLLQEARLGTRVISFAFALPKLSIEKKDGVALFYRIDGRMVKED